MPTHFDSKKLFDTSEFSDITIKVGTREYKCHKIILCNNSDYFKTLCGSASKFKESTQSVVELQDDPPKAAEAVLRHLYGFDYPEIMKCVGFPFLETHTAASAHMDTIIAAQKYLVPKLEHSAFTGLGAVIQLIEVEHSSGEIEVSSSEVAMDVLNLLELLITHQDYHTDLGTWKSRLIETHLSKLFQLARFRDQLETEPWKEALELCKKAVQHGYHHAGDTGDTAFSQCSDCQMVWLAKRFTYCPDCGSRSYIAKLVKWSWT